MMKMFVTTGLVVALVALTPCARPTSTPIPTRPALLILAMYQTTPLPADRTHPPGTAGRRRYPDARRAAGWAGTLGGL